MGLVLTLSDRQAAMHLRVGQACHQCFERFRQLCNNDEFPVTRLDRADDLVVVESGIGAQPYLTHRVSRR